MKKYLLGFITILFSVFLVINTNATNKKYCGESSLTKNIYNLDTCSGELGASREKVAEASSAKTCSGFYKTFVYKNSSGKVIGIFIDNGMCAGASKSFNSNPSGGIENECKKYGGTGNYKWIYSKNSDYAWATIGVVCEVNLGSNNTQNGTLNLDECPNLSAPVCGKKGYYYNTTRKTYKNICFMIKDGAELFSTGECKLRDNKGCLVDKYNWCANLKRCLKKSKYCPREEYVPNLSDDVKQAINPLVIAIIQKIESISNDGETRLKLIDKIGEKVDTIIYRKSSYKAILYYFLQKLEAKRTSYLR